MENVNFQDSIHMFVGILQYFTVPLFGILTLIGILMFTLSFKNPLKRRTAFLLTTLSPIGFVLMLYGPAAIGTYLFDELAQNAEGQTLEILIDWSLTWREPVWNVFTIVVKVISVTLVVIAMGILSLAAKNHANKRIAKGILIGVPVLWLIMLAGPTILNLLTS